MAKIAILTDTDSSLPSDLAASLGIHLVPINIHFGSETFLSCVNIDDADAFARIDRDGKLPTTSAPTPGQFESAYRAAFESGAESIIALCASSAVTAVYSSALAARELFPDREITVVDTHSLGMVQGFMVLAAAEAARKGAAQAAILQQAEAVGARTHLFAAFSTLKYLAMSGRVGHLAAGLAGLLEVKPILTLRNGKLEMLERVRTRRKSWDRVIELTAQAVDGRPIERLAVLHVNALESAREFEAQLRASLPCPLESLTVGLTPGLSVHAGAGLVGVTVVTAP
jgi:DegV family protein with EDD domain